MIVAYYWLSLQIISLESKIQHKHQQQCDEMLSTFMKKKDIQGLMTLFRHGYYSSIDKTEIDERA